MIRSGTTAAGRILQLNGDGSVQVTMWGGPVPASLTAATSAYTIGQACTVQRVGEGASGTWQVVALAMPGALGPNLAPNGSFDMSTDGAMADGWVDAGSTGASTLAWSQSGGVTGGACMSAILTPDQPEGVCVLGTQSPFFIDSRPYTVTCDVATNDATDPNVEGSSTASQASVTVNVITAPTLAGLASDGMEATQTTACSLSPVGNLWSTISGTFTPPPGDVYAHLRILITAAPLAAVAVNLDNVALRATLT